MNINKGLARLWVVVSLPWSVWWGYEYYEASHLEKVFQHHVRHDYQELSHFNPGLGLTLKERQKMFESSIMGIDINRGRKDLEIISCPVIPIVFLMLWAPLHWIYFGYRDRRRTTISDVDI